MGRCSAVGEDEMSFSHGPIELNEGWLIMLAWVCFCAYGQFKSCFTRMYY